MMDAVVFITGAASGIGRETAFLFAEKGARGIISADIDEAGAIKVANESKNYASNQNFRSLALRLDVTNAENVREVVARAVQDFGRIDCGVHCAGVGASSELPVMDVDLKDFDNVYSVNTKGTLLFTSEIVKAMSKQEEKYVEGRNGRRSIGRGSIVNVASLAAPVPVPTHVQYCASKSAALSITRVAASENARRGIRINSLCPSWAETAMMEKDFTRTPELRAVIQQLSPLGRMAKVEEITEAIYFLCGSGASYISGTALEVDAGLSLTRGLA